MILTHKKLVARVSAKEYLRDVFKNAIGELEGAGLFVDKLQIDLDAQLLPWLVEGAMEHLNETNLIQNVLDTVTENLFASIIEQHRKAVEDEKERQRLAKEEQERLEAEKAERIRIRQIERKKREEEQRRERLSGKRLIYFGSYFRTNS